MVIRASSSHHPPLIYSVTRIIALRILSSLCVILYVIFIQFSRGSLDHSFIPLNHVIPPSINKFPLTKKLHPEPMFFFRSGFTFLILSERRISCEEVTAEQNQKHCYKYFAKWSLSKRWTIHSSSFERSRYQPERSFTEQKAMRLLIKLSAVVGPGQLS